MHELADHFSELLSRNGCNVDRIIPEWDLVKLEVNSIISGCKKKKYLEVWQKVFISDYKDSCKNILHVVELLLITPTTNAKLEQMFSRMNRVKTDWHNLLSCERLEHNLRIGEEGPSINDFNPEAPISK